MGSKTYLSLLSLIVLLNNFVNSHTISCNLSQPNSCNGVTTFNGKIYNEEFICHHWNNNENTICIPSSLTICNNDSDCPKGSACKLNQCHIPQISKMKIKRSSFIESDTFIFILCGCIPLIFVGIVLLGVYYAKKHYDKTELKRAQNTNASSLSSMHLYSKNYLYSRSTNNGSSNRSLINYDSPSVDPYNLNLGQGPIAGINMGIMNNGTLTHTMNNGMNMGMGNMENNEQLDFNTQLLLTKNYRMQGFGTNSLQRTVNPTSPKLYVPSPFALKDQQQNDYLHQYQANQSEVTTALSDTTIKDEMKNYSPLAMSPYSNHRSELPAIPKGNKYKKEEEKQSRYRSHRNKINDSDLSQPAKAYGYESKRKENRVSVSPPLKDWNDSYITVQSENDKKESIYNSKRENKRKNGKDMDYYGKDSLSRIKYSRPQGKLNNYGNDYVMALGPTNNGNRTPVATESIIDQYLDDSEDLTMKNMSLSTASSLTYVPDKSMYNMSYNYVKKYKN